MRCTIVSLALRKSVENVIVFALLLSLVAACHSQDLTASVDRVGLQRGVKTLVNRNSAEPGPWRTFVSGRGITATPIPGTRPSVSFAVTPDAEVGPREVVFVSPNRISQVYTFWVDPFVHSPILTSTGSGRDGILTRPGQVDNISFTAKKGETWVFDLVASRVRSPLHGKMEIRSSAGRQVVSSQYMSGTDPRITIKFDESDSFQLLISDAEGKGGPEFRYRVVGGVLPVVNSLSPRGEKPGRNVRATLEGVNLPTDFHASLKIPGGDGNHGWVTAATPRGFTLPFPVICSNELVVALTDTNASMPLPALPGAMEGSFAAYPFAKFFFLAKAGEEFRFTLLAHALGSRFIGAIDVLNANGDVLKTNTGTNLADPVLTFAVQDEGLYMLAIRNSACTTGPDTNFRLRTERLVEDFALSTSGSSVTTKPGATSELHVRLDRQNRWRGAVRLTVEGLPTGIVCKPVDVSPDASEAMLTFVAAPDAKPGMAASIRVIGIGQIGGKNVRRAATFEEKSTVAGGANILRRQFILAVVR
ncbi:MAG: hypothetical protein ABJA67_08080 [Chthonomonadales bacterium]